MDKKLTNSGPLRKPADTHSIYTIKREGGQKLGVHRGGDRRCQGKPAGLLSHISRNTLDRGLHFRHHPLSCVDPVHAGLPEPCVLSHAAHRLNVRLDIGRHELAVTPHASFSINKVGGMAHGADALSTRPALRAEALQLLARCLRVLRDRLEA